MVNITLAELPVKRLLTKDMSTHAIANEHPLMSISKYESFKASISQYGQKEAVVLYRGKIVDGRHRLRALTELGIEEIITRKLPNNLELSEVRSLVLISENRRHQTPTQLAIAAYDWYKHSKCTQREAAEFVGCKLSGFKRVVQLEKLGRIDLIDRLRNDEEIDVSTDSRFNTMTDSLLAVINMVKRERDKLAKEEIMYDEMSTKGKVPKPNEEELAAVSIVKLTAKGKSERSVRMMIAALYEELEDRK